MTFLVVVTASVLRRDSQRAVAFFELSPSLLQCRLRRVETAGRSSSRAFPLSLDQSAFACVFAHNSAPLTCASPALGKSRTVIAKPRNVQAPKIERCNYVNLTDAGASHSSADNPQQRDKLTQHADLEHARLRPYFFASGD